MVQSGKDQGTVGTWTDQTIKTGRNHGNSALNSTTCQMNFSGVDTPSILSACENWRDADPTRLDDDDAWHQETAVHGLPSYVPVTHKQNTKLLVLHTDVAWMITAAYRMSVRRTYAASSYKIQEVGCHSTIIRYLQGAAPLYIRSQTLRSRGMYFLPDCPA